MVWKTAGLGVVLSAALALLFGRLWDPQAVVAGLTFGLLATALQTAAVGLMRPAVGSREAGRLFKRYGAGLALRWLGVLLVPVAVLVARDRFAPLPTAFGFIGVIIPLLFFEARLFR